MTSLLLRLERLSPVGEPVDETAGPVAVDDTANGYIDVAAAERAQAPHVDAPTDDPREGDEPTADALRPWAGAVATSADAAILLDGAGRVARASRAAGTLLGAEPAELEGRELLEVLHVVDLDTGAPDPEYAVRIPPLAALAGPSLSRSLMRIRLSSDATVSVDATATPVHDSAGGIAGSLTFLTRFASV